MKKFMILIVSVVTIFALSGCDDCYDCYDPPSNETTLFLIDQNGFSLGGVPYICDSMSRWSETAPNGEFTFYPPDDCIFDFDGYVGNYEDDPITDDIIYIVDYLDDGKGGIEYDCTSFGVGSTYSDGSFDYDENDECVFYF